MKLRFTPRSLRDLSEIGDYIGARNPHAAPRVRSALVGAIRNLLLFPNAGRRQKVEGVRKLVVPRYPYLIYYIVEQEAQEIAILTIQHAARRATNFPMADGPNKTGAFRRRLKRSADDSRVTNSRSAP